MFDPPADTFRSNHNGTFTSVNTPTNTSPVYSIAAIVRDRTLPGRIVLPSGYDESSISNIIWAAGAYGSPILIRGLHAQELAGLARQILDLPFEAFSRPPTSHERDRIRHLADVVEREQAAR